MDKITAQDGAFSIPADTSINSILNLASLDRQEARILLMHALQLSRSQLITQSDRRVTPGEAQNISHLFQRRLAGEPIAYIVGEREFYGLALFVTPDVLIPRPDTELLVDLGIEKLPPYGRLLDLGTGSGAIAIAIAHARSDADVTAVDYSTAALAVAHRNALRHKVNINLIQSDWYTAVTDRRFDVVVSNPPYIPEHDSHLTHGDLRFEPVTALTDHADGMSALRTIACGASQHLSPGGWLLMEHGYDQSAAVRTLLSEQGFSEVQSWRDLANIERVTGGKLPGSSCVEAQ